LLIALTAIQFRAEPGNHPHEALWRSGPHFGWLGAPVGSGDRVKRCLSQDPAPAAYSVVPKISWNCRMT